MKSLKQTFYLSLILLSFSAYAKQNYIDSLINIAKNANDTSKIKIYQEIAQKYFHKSKDSTITYLNKSIDIADKLFLEYKNDTSLKQYLTYIYSAFNFSTNFFWKNENYDIFLTTTKKYLNYVIYTKDSFKISHAYNNLGNVYKFRSDFDKALKYYQKALSIKEKTGNKRGTAYMHIGIANVFINWKKYPKALKHYQNCYDLCYEISDTIGLAAASTGLGNVYMYQNKITEALRYQKLSYSYYYAIKDTEGIALALLNMGDIYNNINKPDKALKVYNEALNLVTKKDIKIRIALINFLIGNIYNNKKEYKTAISFFDKALKVAKQTDYKKVILDTYDGLANSYKQINDYKTAFKYLANFHNLKDSIFNAEKHKQLTEIETKYKTAQKEKIIKEQKFEIEKDKILNEKRTTQRNLVLIAMFFLLGLMFFIFRSYRIKKRSNLILQKQKDEIENQKNEVQKQKEIIEEIHHEVSQSIDYATRIQKSILPDENILQNHLSEHFIFFKPKDKVSGDFYWWTHIENHTVIAVADCTGHGVPGAFMSMLGASFLREIVEKEYVTHTGVILRKLRKEIIKALKQKSNTSTSSTSGGMKDGMDMAIISINHQTNIMQFSGANNPLYIIKSVIATTDRHGLRPHDDDKNTVIASEQSERGNLPNDNDIATPSARNDALILTMTHNEFGLYEIKPDKMPIAIYERMDNFTTHEIKIEQNDQLYMFSDGFADQFGGEKGKKFKYKPFKRLLLENSGKTMAEQKEIIAKTFNNWIKDYEQVDDITIVGIKI